MKMKTNSIPKQKLIEFLQNSKMDENFVIAIPVNVSQAESFVHRMRVELSRLRDQVRKRNRVPKVFKMMFINAMSINENKCSIILRRTTSPNDVTNEIDEIFDVIAGGEKIHV